MKPKKKKVLVLTDWFLPGYKAGGPIRSIANALKLLSADVDFYVLTTAYDYQSELPYAEVALDSWTNYQGYNVFYSSAHYRKVVTKTLTENWDAVWLNSLWSSNFTLIPLLHSRWVKSNQVILSPRGMFAPEAMRLKSIKKKFILDLFKFLGLYKKVVWHFTNTQELTYAERYLPIRQFQIAANVPVIYNTAMQERASFNSPLKLIYVGRISPEKNTLFAIEVLNKVEVPVVLDIVGAVGNQDYLNLCEQAIQQLPSRHKVQLIGAIPHADLLPYFSQYHFFFLPSKGENFGHAIAESLSVGLPVIISNATPWRQLEQAGCGYDLPLDLDIFAAKINQIARLEAVEYDKMRSAAVGVFQSYFDFKTLKQQYLQLFK